MKITLDYWSCSETDSVNKHFQCIQGSFGRQIRGQFDQIRGNSIKKWKQQQEAMDNPDQALQTVAESDTGQVEFCNTALYFQTDSDSQHKQKVGYGGGFGSIQVSQEMIRCPVTKEDRGKLQYIIDELRRKRREQMTELERTIRDPEARERIAAIKQFIHKIHTFEQAIESIAYYRPSTRSTTVITSAYDHLQENDPDFPFANHKSGWLKSDHSYFKQD